MNIPFSVASQLALALAGMPALALAGQIAQPVPVDPAPSASLTQSGQAVSDERSSPKQKPILGKDERTVIAGVAESATSANLIPAKGVVLHVDQAKATVKIDHDPIPALGWPRMTMSFRLKEHTLASTVKEGNAVEFFLEKSGSDYIIVKFRMQAPIRTKETKGGLQ
ncbi:copper-binding protein [Nitrosospira sp. Nsp13]|uniref:copper-binding protein n=1 Tax=Nitrosospira sp. Nsp13 TaxID=1855332 RepID=UPI00087FC48F|nr:copper-binding protein [Nitrosospira sp. Nsp13]SCX80586.1 Cu(I)/Ag(I) efflux system protein CusF [Nitrosospira sp. Nsp13]